MKDARVQAALLVALAFLLMIAGYVFQPFWTADRLVNAFRQGDVHEAAKLVDYARVRDSIHAQLGSGLRGDAADALTAMIDASVHPEHFAAFLRNGTLLSPEEADKASSRVLLPRPRTRSLVGLAGFRVQYHRLALSFSLEGLQWRLVSVEFADAVADKLRAELGSMHPPVAMHAAE